MALQVRVGVLTRLDRQPRGHAAENVRQDDFLRLPLTSDQELFKALAEKGEELVALHLMESPVLNQLITGFPVAGSNEVVKVRYVERVAEDA